MRKMICLLAAMLLLAAMAVPAFATGETTPAGERFVPSITYKDGPEVEDAELNEEDVGGCVVVTSILEAKNKSTDIYQETRDQLLEVYEELSEGGMELPFEDDKDYVVRELVDVSFMVKTCLESDHTHEEELNQEGITATVVFDLGVSQNTDVHVFCYRDGQWIPAASVVNNGDGTVTVVLDFFGPVAFCIEAGAETPPPQTGDDTNLTLYIVLLAISLVAIVVLTVLYKASEKKKR